MSESESDALPLGDTPIFGFVLTTYILYQKAVCLSIVFLKNFLFFYFILERELLPSHIHPRAMLSLVKVWYLISILELEESLVQMMLTQSILQR